MMNLLNGFGRVGFVCWVAVIVLSPELSAQSEKHPFAWINPLTSKELKAAPGLSHHTFKSRIIKKAVGYCVFVPQGYNDSRNKDRRYPVVYMVHGGRPGDESRFANRLPYIIEAISDGDLIPTIVVLNNGGPVSHYNVPGRPEARGKDMFVEELMPLIAKKYRTIETREGRALQGYSQGGRATARIGFGHPELFSQLVIGSAGAATEKRIQETGGIENENLIFAPGDDMWTYAEIYAKNFTKKYPMKIFLHVGDELDSNYDGNIAYDRFLTDIGLGHTFVVIPETKHGGVAYVKLHDKIIEFQNDSFRRSLGLR
ncbi:MAG: alpha/beta hydrolase-fold protein [Opitutaceae bacterium]|nr:alpha/beta hydrolase-fold protein [Opitutaceae bacterium]